MAVYVDWLQTCIPNKHWPWNQNCHLMADTLEELHEFAAQIGLKRSWFQNHITHPHYDLTAGKRALAIAKGAREVDREWYKQQLEKRRTIAK